MIVALDGVGQQVDDVIHEHQAAQAVHSRTAQNREQAQILHALVHTLDHFCIGEGLFVEELVHQLFVGLSHSFLQRVVEFLDDIFLALWNFDLNTLQVLHLVSALIEHVDDAGNLAVCVPDGNDHGSDLIAVLLTQSVEGGIVVGVILVYLGNVDETGHVTIFTVFPCLLKADGNAVLGRANKDRCVSGAEAFHHSTGEIECTGSVDQVDLNTLVLQRHNGCGNGDITLDLLGIIIANGVAVGIFADTVNDTGHVEKTFCQSSFAAAAMAQQANVTDRIGCVHM